MPVSAWGGSRRSRKALHRAALARRRKIFPMRITDAARHPASPDLADALRPERRWPRFPPPGGGREPCPRFFARRGGIAHACPKRADALFGWKNQGQELVLWASNPVKPSAELGRIAVNEPADVQKSGIYANWPRGRSKIRTCASFNLHTPAERTLRRTVSFADRGRGQSASGAGFSKWTGKEDAIQGRSGLFRLPRPRRRNGGRTATCKWTLTRRPACAARRGN